jgi:hypothetical protein
METGDLSVEQYQTAGECFSVALHPFWRLYFAVAVTAVDDVPA